MTIGERVQIRLEEAVREDRLNEIVTVACDRIMLRAGVSIYDDEGVRTDFPAALESIAVDVAVKIVRRANFEGIKSESADTLSTTFVDDIISEYTEEINGYKRSTTRMVSFI